MKRLKYLLLAGAVSTLSIFAVSNDFDLVRNTEILINILRELSENYVDEVDTDDLMKYATEGMTKKLDPYTTYLPEEEMADFMTMTTGKYGGIGSVIRQSGDFVMVAQPYEGSPADKAGLIIGDKIVAIEGESAKGWSVSDVSSKLKGTPNTELNIRVKRLLDDNEEDITITRERISIPPIPYYGMVGEASDSVGYIQQSEFSEGVAREMRKAIEDLRQKGMRTLILDYRNNGGGILQEAVDIVSLFAPKGTEVVKIKGRKDSTSYYTSSAPIAPDMPLVVLINENSASAAEIVAGSLQDLDRAVLVGAKSFGKGLVQSPRPVGYNAYIKLTTSKYYIPSGRCIQAIDYSDHSSAGHSVKVADSLRRTFYTKGGRKVYDGGGVSPDIEVEPEYVSRFAATLYAMGFIDEYCDIYFKRNHANTIDVETFTISEDDYTEFKEFIATKDVPYESATRRVLKSLKEAAIEDLYSDVAADIEALESNLKDDKESNLETYRNEIIESINNNIVMRHDYVRGVIRRSLLDDTDLNRALEVALNVEEYNQILSQQ